MLYTFLSKQTVAQMSETSIIGRGQRFKRNFKELELLKLEQEIRLKEMECITELLKNYQKLSSYSDDTIDEYAKKRFKNAFISVLPDFQAEHCSISPFESVPMIFTEEISDENWVHTKQSHDKESTIVDELKQALESVDETTSITDGKKDEGGKVVSTKLDKKTAFSIKDVIKELGLNVDNARVPAMCKTVCTRFKEARPGSEMLSRQRQTYFYLHDKEYMKKLVREEYAKYLMKKVDE